MNLRSALLCFALLCIAFSGINAAKPLDFFSDGSLQKGLKFESWPGNTTLCGIRNSDWIISVSDDSINWGGCGAINQNKSIDLTDYIYLEIDISVNNPPKDHNIIIKIELQDTRGIKGSVQIALLPQDAKLRFPLANFDTADLSKINGLLINLYELKSHQEAVISGVKFVGNDKFPVFRDDTSIAEEPVNGPVVLFSWPDNAPACNAFFPDADAPEGAYVLSIGNGTWGCGFFNFPFNFAAASSLKFSLNSKVAVLLEFTDNSGNKRALPNVPSTNGKWKTITIQTSTLSGLGLDLRTVNFEFMITKVGSANNDVFVDNIRFLY